MSTVKENEKYMNVFETQSIKVIQTMQSNPQGLPGNNTIADVTGNKTLVMS